MSDRERLKWLMRRTAQQVGYELLRKLGSDDADLAPTPPADLNSELARFQASLDTLSESDLAIYGTALAGLEDTLLSPRSLVYRELLDHLVGNIGGLLDDLGCFDIFGGEVGRAEIDLRWAPSLRARVVMDVALPLEQTRRRLRGSPALARFFEGQMPCLVIHRLYRPRLLRPAEPDLWLYGIVGRDRSVPQDATYLALRQLPESAPTTQAELPIIVQRSRLRDILLSEAPARQEVVPRLLPADFMALLQGLLLDARAYCYRRARDQQELEQLNQILFEILARSGARPDVRAAMHPE